MLSLPRILVIKIMKSNIRQTDIEKSNPIQTLMYFLSQNERTVGLDDASVYCDFPVYKNIDEEVVIAQLILISKNHGVILFRVSDAVRELNFDKEQSVEIGYLDELYSLIFAILIRNKSLIEWRNSFIVPIQTIFYAPLFTGEHKPKLLKETDILYTDNVPSSFITNTTNIVFDILNSDLSAPISY